MDNPQRILVIQLKRAGDVLLTTPILQVLAQRFPEAQVDCLVGQAFAPILDHNPWVHHVQPYDFGHGAASLRRVRALHYDWIIDFQSSPRSALVAMCSGARWTSGYRVPFWGRFYQKTVPRPRGSQYVVKGKYSLVEPWVGPMDTLPSPLMVLSAEEKAWALEALPVAAGRTVIGIVPTHRRVSRRWERSSFAALARRFTDRGYEVWLFWGPGENAYVESIRSTAPQAQLIPSASLRQMAALLARCQLVVTNDNGPMHLAVAVGAPTVTVYGPTDPVCWNPGGSRHVALQADGLSCLGCNLNACPFGHECMTQLTPENVLQACETMLRHSQLETTSSL